ncbi:MAG: branched-chain amino acid ABC transporter permease [Alkalispirochaetaceae bacterium]
MASTYSSIRTTVVSFLQRHKAAVSVLTALLLLALPWLLTSGYHLRVMTLVGIYVLLVSGLNVIIGFTGMFSLGHAAFYGIGAYTSAMLTVMAGWPFWLALPIAGIVAGAFGTIIGLATLRLRRVFLAFTTLGFGEITRIVILNWRSFTRGPMGISGIPVPTLFEWSFTARGYYYLILLLAAVTVATMYRMYYSRVGRALIAIREDETAASSMGINVFGYKVLAFTVGCFFAGIAGSFFAHFQRYVSADSFANLESFSIITMLALGGTGSIIGPILGSTILVVLPEVFRVLMRFRGVIYGLTLIIVIVYRPGGLANVKGIFEKPKLPKRPRRQKGGVLSSIGGGAGGAR